MYIIRVTKRNIEQVRDRGGFSHGGHGGKITEDTEGLKNQLVNDITYFHELGD